MSSEEWRPVPGWEYYEVSSLGRVRSLDRIVGCNGGTRVAHGRVLTATPNSTGYLCITLHEQGEGKNVQVHSLVLEAFVGPKPDGLEARHLDGNHLNNCLDNLRWGTRSENILDRVRHGTHSNSSKTTCLEGHPFDYVNPSTGKRGCKRCHARWQREYYARKKALA